jgi:hypothetical protein
MRSFLCVLLLFGSARNFAQAPAASPSATAQDAAALQILKQAVHTLAPSPASARFKDYALTGSIEVPGTPGDNRVKILARGSSDLHFEIAFADGKTHSVITREGHGGRIRNASGNERKITHNSRAGTEIAFLPVPSALAEMVASARLVEDGGSETVNGRAAQRVVIARQYPKEKDPFGTFTERSRTELFIDVESFVILKIRHSAYPPDASAMKSVVRELEFSDYREVNGCLAPFQISETLDGQKSWTIYVTSLDFSPNLADPDFQF